MILAGVVEERGPLEQAAKASAELPSVTRQVIRTKLIDHDHDDKRGTGFPLTRPGLLCRRGSRPEAGDKVKTNEQSVAHTESVR